MAYTWGAASYRDSYYYQQVGIDMTVSGTTVSWGTQLYSSGSMYSTSPYSVSGAVSRSGNYTASSGGAFSLTYASGSFSSSEGASPSISTNATIFWGGKPSHSRSISIPVTASTPTVSKSSISAGDTVTINFNRKSSSYKFDLAFRFSSTVIETVVSNSTSTSTTHAPTAAQIGPRIPNATSGTFNYLLTTRNSSGTSLGTRSVNISCSLPASVIPTISSASVSDATVLDMTGTSPYEVLRTKYSTSTSFIQKLSSASISASTSGVVGSTVQSVSFSINGTVFSQIANPIFSTSGTNTVKVWCVDSRGRKSAEYSISVPVIAYSEPKITPNPATVRRCDSSGNLDELGTYALLGATSTVTSVSVGGANRNARTMTVGYRLATSTGNYTSMYSLSNSTGMSGAIPSSTAYGSGGLASDKAYSVLFTVKDIFQEVTQTVNCSSSQVTMSWAEKGIGVGKIHQSGSIDNGGIFVGLDSISAFQVFEDNRTLQPTPADYVSIIGKQGVKHNFTSKASAGLPAGATGSFFAVTTTLPWTGHNSGYPMYQETVDSSGVSWRRMSTSSSTWGPWGVVGSPNDNNIIVDGVSYKRSGTIAASMTSSGTTTGGAYSNWTCSYPYTVPSGYQMLITPYVSSSGYTGACQQGAGTDSACTFRTFGTQIPTDLTVRYLLVPA